MKVRDSIGRVWDTDQLTLGELEVLYADVAEAQMNIKSAIEYAIAEAKSTGVEADQIWFAKTKSALRYKNKHEGFLRAEIAKRKREARREQLPSPEGPEAKNEWRKSLAYHFIQVVREQVDSKTFDAYMEEAKRRTSTP